MKHEVLKRKVESDIKKMQQTLNRYVVGTEDGYCEFFYYDDNETLRLYEDSEGNKRKYDERGDLIYEKNGEGLEVSIERDLNGFEINRETTC
jgi:hypothetical protein